mmetsp:Transcript_5868/g.6748  ORF Transcript_5868/g.6748 Transcript_5868/m.6748 type:complete len:274 (+) Transcript_5868:13-834(+)
MLDLNQKKGVQQLKGTRNMFEPERNPLYREYSNEETEEVNLEELENPDERICRICFEGGDYGENGHLFRPCLCSGTSAWVHMECLDQWRRSSTNPKSFYRCDQCQYEYKFGRVFAAYDGLDRFTLARILQMRFAVHFVSVLVLLLLIFIGGFITKLFTPGLTWGDVFNFLNLQHFTGGSVLLGMGSLIGWLASLFASAPGMGPRLWFLDTGMFRSRGSDDANKVLVAIVVVIGLLVALRWIYSRVSEYAEYATRHAAHIVLDVRQAKEEKFEE